MALQVWNSETEALVHSASLKSESKGTLSNSTDRYSSMSTMKPSHLLYVNFDRNFGKYRENEVDIQQQILRTRENFQPERIQFHVPDLKPNVRKVLN